MPAQVSVNDFATKLRSRLARLDSLHVDPKELAELFRFTVVPSPRADALRGALHEYLLRLTLQHACAHCPWYRDNPGYCEPSEPHDLTALPIIDRQTLLEHAEELLADDRTTFSISHTSGTTGAALNIHKSPDEVQWLQSYYESLFRPIRENLPSLPLSLFFPNAYHGVPVPLPSLGRVFIGGVTDDLLIQDAVGILRSAYKIDGCDERISMISGLAFHVMFFTSFLLEQGIDPRCFGIRNLNITGRYTSQHERRFISDAWEAPVNDRYTLTEVVGGASRCHACGKFHLDPHILGEAIDMDTGKPVTEGVGFLVLTNFYPFVQKQPLVRYNTGDLVRVAPSRCNITLTFDFLGKASNCVRREVSGRSEWVLFSAELYEILSALPDVRINEWFSNVRVAHDRSVGSQPIYAVDTSSESSGSLSIRLTPELRYAPHYYAGRLEEMRRHIAEGLRAANASLARGLDEQDIVLKIDFAGPDTLGERGIQPKI